MAPTFCLRLAWGLIASMLLLAAGADAAALLSRPVSHRPGAAGRGGVLPRGHEMSAWLRSDFAFQRARLCGRLDKSGTSTGPRWPGRSWPWPSPAWFRSCSWQGREPLLDASTAPAPMFEDLSSAALLGSCTSAMLMGHSYLIAPAMSLSPLLRLLAAMAVSLAVRVLLAGIGLFQGTKRRRLHGQ